MSLLTKRLRAVIVPLLALAIWGLLTWPLPRHFADSMPYTAHSRQGAQITRALVPGDHLQLLYHFWLLRDMLADGTPWMHNLYEFNSGDDAARRQFDPGYLPFSLVYAAFSPVLGHAVGWNLAQLAALMATFFFLWRLALRYASYNGSVNSFVPPLVAALAAFCAPYQWTNLGSGSPSGFGMAWVPAIALGLDLAIRDDRPAGGLLAAVSLFWAYTSDLHSFFFGALLMPAWCLVAWVAREDASFWPTRRQFLRLLRALWPVLLAGCAILPLAKFLQSGYSATDVAGGRSLFEVAANSPSRRSLFGWILHGHDLHFQLGIALPLLLLVTALASFFQAWRDRRQYPPEDAKQPEASVSADVRSGNSGAAPSDPSANAATAFAGHIRANRLAVTLMLAGGIALILVLGLGMRGPFGGLPIRVLRKVLPPYRMIRQPVKIMVLLPTLIAPLAALGCGVLWQSPDTATTGRRRRLWAARSMVIVLTLTTVAGTKRIIRYAVCQLPAPNAAYGAVVRQAEEKGQRPHILALPIWPGDSAQSSIYEYQIMPWRIRMLNGYAPVVHDDYLEKVYRVCESVTQGRLTATQAAALREMGVTAVVLHEEFPTVVSPFPVAATFNRLRQSPWLEFLERDGSAWAFALRDAPASGEPTTDQSLPLLPVARWWRFDQEAADAANDEDGIRAALRSPVADWPELRWLVRTVGDGQLRVSRTIAAAGTDPTVAIKAFEDEVSLEGRMFFARSGRGTTEAAPGVTQVALTQHEGRTIRWLAVPPGPLPDGWGLPQLELESPGDEVEVTDIILAAGQNTLGVDHLVLPAAHLFRGGLTILREGEPSGVLFRPAYDSADEVLRGPNLPLAAGSWRLRIEGEFGAARTGELHISADDRLVAVGPVGSGAAEFEFELPTMAPLVLQLHYDGLRDMQIDSFVLQKVDP